MGEPLHSTPERLWPNVRPLLYSAPDRLQLRPTNLLGKEGGTKCTQLVVVGTVHVRDAHTKVLQEHVHTSAPGMQRTHLRTRSLTLWQTDAANARQPEYSVWLLTKSLPSILCARRQSDRDM